MRFSYQHLAESKNMTTMITFGLRRMFASITNNLILHVQEMCSCYFRARKTFILWGSYKCVCFVCVTGLQRFEISTAIPPHLKLCLLSVWGQEIFFFRIFSFYVTSGVQLKGVAESSLLSKDEPLI